MFQQRFDKAQRHGGATRASQRNAASQSSKAQSVIPAPAFAGVNLSPHTRGAGIQPAFTMTEVLIVVAILALLIAVLLGVAGFIETRKNTALPENCLDILDAALPDFH